MTQPSGVPESFRALVYLIVQSNGNTARAGVLIAIAVLPIVASITLAGPVVTMSTITGLSSIFGATHLLLRGRR